MFILNRSLKQLKITKGFKNTTLVILGISFLVFLSLIFFLNQNLRLQPKQDRDAVKLSAEKIFSNCLNHKIDDPKIEDDREHCYYQQFTDLAQKDDIEFVMKVLSKLEELDSSTRGCHFIAHAITYGETIKDPNSWREILGKINPNDCSGGFIHGILEARTRVDPNFSFNEKSLPEICSDIRPGLNKTAEFSCIHIMGHLLMVDQTGDIAKSVDICAKIPKEMQFGCFSGVFMENETRDELVSHGLAHYITWNQSTTHDQEQICRQYSGLAALACWREIAHLYASVSNNNPTEVYSRCYNIPLPEAAGYCYTHALPIMVTADNFRPDYMPSLCKAFEEQKPLFNNCMNSVIGGLLTSTLGFMDRAASFCESIPAEDQKDCFSMIANFLKNQVSTEKQQGLCLKVPDKYRDDCNLR